MNAGDHHVQGRPAEKQHRPPTDGYKQNQKTPQPCGMNLGTVKGIGLKLSAGDEPLEYAVGKPDDRRHPHHEIYWRYDTKRQQCGNQTVRARQIAIKISANNGFPRRGIQKLDAVNRIPQRNTAQRTDEIACSGTCMHRLFVRMKNAGGIVGQSQLGPLNFPHQGVKDIFHRLHAAYGAARLRYIAGYGQASHEALAAK